MHKQMTKIGRHGDVLLVKMDETPDFSQMRKVEHGRVAEGEVTGHSHRLTGDAELFERDGELWIRTGPAKSSIIHQEHKEIFLPADSALRVTIQREMTLEGPRNVID